MNQQARTAFAAKLAGTAIAHGDSGYDPARKLWNGTVDKRPAVIARCRGADDVVAAVRFAKDNGLDASIRGGGHHVAGGALNDGGVVIDLSGMRGVRFDASTHKARAEGGALLADVDRATLAHGRAVPLGVFGETGVGGLTLGGGYGWQSRSRGLACDNLVSAEVVTSDGRLLEVSGASSPDLFWAARGGGTNLGVVTAFEYSTYPMPAEVFFTFVTYPLAEAGQVWRSLREYARTAPNSVGLISVIWTFPGSAPFPQSVWGKPFVAIVGTCTEPAAQGERIMAPLRQLGSVLFDGSKAMPFATVQTFFDEDYPDGRRYYWRSSYLRDLGDAAIDKLVELGGRRPSPLTSLDLWVLGGAIADVSVDATPIVHRTAPWMVGIESNWDDPAEDAQNVAWAREVFTAMEPHATGGSYVNFEDAADRRRVAAVYGANFQPLTEVKRKYDPDNLFG